jgi:hypothetical protein
MYLFYFELLKSLKLTFIDYLEIKIWKKLWCNNMMKQ